MDDHHRGKRQSDDVAHSPQARDDQSDQPFPVAQQLFEMSPAQPVVGVILTCDGFMLVQRSIGQSHRRQDGEGDCH